jgi:VanZ family protein
MSLWIAAGYLLFVVYGSLVPLDYHPRPLDSAWRDFLQTRYLMLGVGPRADWVANILLYIPLAYLLCAGVVAGVRSAVARLIAIAAVFVVCAAVALGVEFTQLFFPPRTVSLNDIVAEFVGSGLGIGLWLAWGRKLEQLWADMTRGGLPAIRAAVVGYVVAYLAFSLFPYDFLVSAQEFAEKFPETTTDCSRRLLHAAGCLCAPPGSSPRPWPWFRSACCLGWHWTSR